jgi:DNA-binding phage protein
VRNAQIILNHIAKSIRRRIEDAGYASVDQFCKENKIVKSTVYRAIKNERSPRFVTLIEIADALGISLQDLLDLEKINLRRK